MLLINPDARVNKDIPNIGLAYIASYLNSKVIDLNTKSRPAKRFLAYKSESVGISVQSRSHQDALRIARMYKEKYPQANIKFVSGVLDVQCCYPYLKLADNMHIQGEFSDSLSIPNYELFDSFELFRTNWQKDIWRYAIMTSKGCPYQCLYCAARDSKWQARSAANCCQELKLAKDRWGIKSFSIIDDCFNIDRGRVVEFCDLIKPLNLSWSCANGLRADRFDESLAKKMKDAGCDYVGFGIESTDPKVLNTIRKGEDINTIELAVDAAKKYFDNVNGYFIIGLPGSSYEKDLNSLRWAEGKHINAFFSYYLPFKALMEGGLFYGPGAKAQSQEYSSALQEKIYVLTKSMRPKEGNAWRLRSFLGRIKEFFKSRPT